MKGFKETSLSERRETSAKAKQALLDKVKALKEANQEGLVERQAARAKQAEEREARIAQRKAEKLEQERREAEALAAAEAARLEADRQAAAEREAKANEEKTKIAKLLADQKAFRDARYAARKARLK